MKVFLKIISPNREKSFINEFTIEHQTPNMPFAIFLQKLKELNLNLYKELNTEDFFSSNYLCIVNNEIKSNSQQKSLIFNDGDKIVISYAIGGG